MHPRQADLLNQSVDLTEKLAAKAPGTSLWKYTDPEGHVFYLEEKLTTVKSPWSGKSFTAKPKKFTPAQVGQEMREEQQGAAGGKKSSEDVEAAGKDPFLEAVRKLFNDKIFKEAKRILKEEGEDAARKYLAQYVRGRPEDLMKTAGHEQGLWDALTPIAENILGG